MFDTHLHTEFSIDSQMTLKEAMESAQSKGLGIIVTEHLDIEYPENPDDFIFDIDEYFAAFEQFRSDKVLLGVELGLRTECNEKNEEIIKDKNFDEIIGSIHVVDGMDIYRKSFTTNIEKKHSYGKYFAAMLDCIASFDDFDTLGHVDYICRYAAYDDPEIYLEDFYDEWTSICRALIEKEKVLELNTRRLDNRFAVEKLVPLYKHYKILGGKYITIGSDAHKTIDVGKEFSFAHDLADNIGLKPVYFKNRKMILDKK